MTSFGHFIKVEREKRNWTQTDFGARIGINATAISRIENGSQKFSTTKLIMLSNVLQVDLQIVKDLFYADKFAREAFKNKCSEDIFNVAEETVKYLKLINTKQGEIFS
ncbi:MAG: helix-turn-helix transcriptional regulator [Ferruginibacter sp.]